MFACIVNACNIAIINSGLEMKCNVAAIHCILNDEGSIEVDPEFLANDVQVRISKARRNKKFKANFTFVFDSLNENLISVTTNGSFTLKNYNEALQLSKHASRQIFNFYSEITRKYASVI
jgi:exosome complex component RRP46